MQREKMRLAVELVKHGGSIMKEPCEKCGGVQVRYKGKVFCTSHDDLTKVLSTEEITYDSIALPVRMLILSKIREISQKLEKEKDSAKEDQMVSLLDKYVQLLQKLPESSRRMT